MAVAVQLDQVTRTRHYRPLFVPVCVQATAGQVWHVQGPNGIGKSSLLKIIAGVSPFVGHCQVQASIGYVGHQPGLYGQLSALENLQYAQLWYAPNQPKDPKQALDTWGVPLHLPVQALSAGQRQAVALLRVYCLQSQCWLLDESMQCLDGQRAQLWQQSCAAHIARGGLIFFTSHADQDPLCSLATHRLILEACA